MPRYCVNASVTYLGWVYVEADSAEDAITEAEDVSRDFEYDPGTAQVDFNVTPMVEPA